MRKLHLIILLALTLTATAQNKKAIKQMKADVETVRDNIKKSKDLDKMETLVRKHLADSLFANDMTLHVVLTDLLKKQYEDGNERMYLKNKPDTLGLINTGKRLFIACQQLDSLDAMPNAKGISSPQYRKRNAEYLAPYRKNIFNGGLYLFKHSRWSEAWDMMNTYLDTRQQPLFSNTELDSSSDHYAAYVAVMAANNMSDLGKAKTYAEEAMQYAPAQKVVAITMAELAKNNNDTALYETYLMRGFKIDAHSPYFFPRLIDYRTERGEYDEARRIADEALQTDSTNQLFLLAKHTVEMSRKNYADALTYGHKVLEQNDSLDLPNYNVALIYYNQAQEAMKKGGTPLKQRTKNAQKHYRLCRPYMEQYRRLRPKEIKRWRPVLYDVYLNLNMGKEFAEIESIGN